MIRGNCLQNMFYKQHPTSKVEETTVVAHEDELQFYPNRNCAAETKKAQIQTVHRDTPELPVQRSSDVLSLEATRGFPLAPKGITTDCGGSV